MTGNATAAQHLEESHRRTLIARVLAERATDIYDDLWRALRPDEPDLQEVRREFDELGTLLFVVAEELREIEQRG